MGVPQLTWVTMPLDVATFVGDVMSGVQQKWDSYEKRGARLWQEYQEVHSPVVREILKKLRSVVGGDLDTQPKAYPTTEPAVFSLPSSDVLIVDALTAVDVAIREYSETGSMSARKYQLFRSLFLSVGITSNQTSPAAPTCRPLDLIWQSTGILV